MDAGKKTLPLTPFCLYITVLLLLVGTVSAAAPDAAFSGTPVSGAAPLTVAFTDTSTGEPTGWAWFFGDESYGETWAEQTANAGWAARVGHTAVALPDGSIVIMGGYDNTGPKNDTWRSTDSGVTWTLVNASPGWSARTGHTSVTMPDGSILLMGGYDDTCNFRNDVWRSTDGGATWTLVNASAGWTAREWHASVALPDRSILLMGGLDDSYSYKNDVWRSVDYGATWTQMSASSGWARRYGHAAVAMPDGSILLMGGDDGNFPFRNDTWRSTDYGATWTLVNESSGWPERHLHTSVAMPDGNVLLMGGVSDDGTRLNDAWRSVDNGRTWRKLPDAGLPARQGHAAVAMPDGSIILLGGEDESSFRNDVWRLQPAGSSEQDPQHEYTASGTYSVTLQAFNADGCDCTRTTGYITVLAVPPTAAFSGTPTSGLAPLTVAFTDISAGEPSSWLWSFGDGKTSTEQHPRHTYAVAGTYTVNLTVSNTAGTDTLSETGYIMVSAPTVVPKAAFSGTPVSGAAPLTVSFTDRSTEGPTGWAWFFGDETYDEPWMLVNASSGWAARSGHSSVALADGSIVVMGGYDGTTCRNDTWRSTDSGVTWTLVNASPGWTARLRHTSVAMPDGSILLMGGRDDIDSRNDVWRSDDGGATWTEVNASAGWSMREAHTAVATPDGNVVLMGGWCYGSMNDVWRSTDCGATWTLVNASAGWSKRVSLASVAMPDGSIILMGGYDSANFRNMNDVWRSTDCGATWTRVNESSGWSERDVHTAVAMPDGSIVLMGGWDGTEFRNDVWRSCDYGATWTEVSPGTGWSGRASHNSVAVPDGSIILMGGGSSSSGPLNDVWRFQPAGSTEQNPSHTYTAPGNYSVTLQAFNADGYGCTREAGYITVTRGKGDFNGDGVIDIGDVARVAYMVVGKAAADPAADFNQNGAVDIGDAAKIAYYYIGKIPAL